MFQITWFAYRCPVMSMFDIIKNKLLRATGCFHDAFFNHQFAMPNPQCESTSNHIIQRVYVYFIDMGLSTILRGQLLHQLSEAH